MKKTLLFVLIGLLSFNVFAEKWNIYAGADAKTLETIKACDELIESRKYQSAVNKVGECNNEYIIYKYIEVCTQYFAQSMMHSMFAFKDLEEGETLYSVRTGDGSFNMAYRDDPEKIINNYVKAHGKSIILDLAKANYYFDALSRYGNQWLKTPEYILSYSKEVYERAIKADIFDEMVLSNYVSILIQENEFVESEKLCTLLTEHDPSAGVFWYNLTVCKMHQGKYTESIETAKKAVENPEEDPDNNLDAYLILADAYSYSGDYKTAEEILFDAHKKYDYQPIVMQRLGELYIRPDIDNVDYKKAEEYFNKTLDIVCDANTIYSCINEYMYYGASDKAIEFCTKNIKSRKDKLTQGIFNYFLTQIYMYSGDKSNAKKSLTAAEKAFKKAKNAEWLKTCGQLKDELNK